MLPETKVYGGPRAALCEWKPSLAGIPPSRCVLCPKPTAIAANRATSDSYRTTTSPLSFSPHSLATVGTHRMSFNEKNEIRQIDAITSVRNVEALFQIRLRAPLLLRDLAVRNAPREHPPIPADGKTTSGPAQQRHHRHHAETLPR